MRHPWEIPLLVVGVAFTLLLYAIWIAMIIYAIVLLASGRGDTVEEELANAGIVTQLVLLLLALPFLIWIARALMYAQLRVSSVRMSPTQFPEGYRMVSEAAFQFGLRRVPDAYVSLGNGVINASPPATASGGSSRSTPTCSRSAAQCAIPRHSGS